MIGTDPELARILAFAEEKTEGKRFLKRADVNPAELKDILPDICFFSPVYAEDGTVDDVFITLMGTRAASFYGDHTNKHVSEHPFPEVADRVTSAIQVVVAERGAFQAEAEALTDDHTYLTVKAAYIPMSEDGETIDRVFVYVRVKPKSPVPVS